MKPSVMLCASLVTFAAFALSDHGASAQATAPAQERQASPPVAAPPGDPNTCTAGTKNLVQNPGFETGNLPPWVVAWPNPPDPYTHVQASGPPNSHSGAHYLTMGAVPGINSATQNINGTVAGDIYTVCFWLKHDAVAANGSAQNSFEVRWGGRALFTLIGDLGFDWTLHRFAVRATGTDALRFDAQEVPAFWHLDDVGVFLGGPAPFARELPTAAKKAP